MNFEKLKKYKEIIIIGHNLRDFDSMFSGVLLEYILNKQGINAKYVLLENFTDDFYIEVRSQLNLPTNFSIGIKKEDILFLVDHTCDYENKIVGCFDHHPKISRQWDNYLNLPKSACAKVIYDYAIKKGIDIPKNYTIGVMLACYYDTMSFTTTKATKDDILWCKQLISKYNLNEKEIEKRGFGLTDKALPFEKYIRSNAKYYKTKNGLMYATYVITDDNFDMQKCVENLKKSITGDVTRWCFILANVSTKNTEIVYITPEYHISTRQNKILSRGKDIIPFIMSFIESENDGTLTKTLIQQNKQISTMESCTGGLIASTITDYEGASSIFKGSVITYSNSEKINAGVNRDVISKYGVYSIQTADEMAKSAKEKYKSDFAIGVTGTFANIDTNNSDSVSGEIYFAIIDTDNKYLSMKITLHNIIKSRKDIKQQTVDIIVKVLCAKLK